MKENGSLSSSAAWKKGTVTPKYEAPKMELFLDMSSINSDVREMDKVAVSEVITNIVEGPVVHSIVKRNRHKIRHQQVKNKLGYYES